STLPLISSPLSQHTHARAGGPPRPPHAGLTCAPPRGRAHQWGNAYMSAAANGCRVLGEAVEYPDLPRILRPTAQDTAVSRETIDAVAGIQSGYSSKLLAPVPSKCLGQVSMGLLPGAWRTPFPRYGRGSGSGALRVSFLPSRLAR